MNQEAARMNQRTAKIDLRLTPDEKRGIESAAAGVDLTISDYVRRAALKGNEPNGHIHEPD